MKTLAIVCVLFFALHSPAMAQDEAEKLSAFDYAHQFADDHRQLIYDVALLRVCGNEAIASKVDGPLGLMSVYFYHKGKQPSWNKEQINLVSTATISHIMGMDIGASTVYRDIKQQFGMNFIEKICIEAAERSLKSLE